MDRAQKTSIRICPIGKNEGKLCYSPDDVRKAAMSAYYQAERDFFVKAEKWLFEIHRVCDITDEHGYRIDVRELIGRFEEYIKQ